MKIRRALLSVFDKTNLKELAFFLAAQKIELISTGGTARFLRENHLAVQDVSDITQFPEILDSRVKTLHPAIHAGLLASRTNAKHLDTLKQHQISPIDLVVINLYPFETIALDPLASTEALIENIDIGGPSMLRSAAKNYEHVVVLSDPEDYAAFIKHFFDSTEEQSRFRQELAIKAFAKTSQYDQEIAQTLSKRILNQERHKQGLYSGKKSHLRYGENPHQKASVYAHSNDAIQLASTKPIQGKELSYNNLLDADASLFALRCLLDGSSPQNTGAVVIKHGTPCGAAIDKNLISSLKKSLASDPISAFGGIVALSHEVDLAAADVLAALFLEVIIAPGFSKEALLCLSRKKDLRLLVLENMMTGALASDTMRSINGGVLTQEHDRPFTHIHNSEIVTQRKPTLKEWQDMDFAFRVCIPCRSNAITLASQNQLQAVGAGQTSRVDAVRSAIEKAKDRKHILDGAALGSDAFFPFPDSVEIAAQAGITAIIQPGGSKRDGDVIAAANAYNLTMIFTKERHFRH